MNYQFHNVWPDSLYIQFGEGWQACTCIKTDQKPEGSPVNLAQAERKASIPPNH